MEIKGRSRYIAPRMAIHLVESEEGIAAGSAKVKTGWSTNGEQNQPKEKEWEAGWNNSKDFDL